MELPSDGPLTCAGDLTGRVSDHYVFPRWDGPIEDAFEQAAWPCEGPLPRELDELVAEPA